MTDIGDTIQAWRPVSAPGHEGYGYEVSNLGLVRRRLLGSRYRMISPFPNNKGYLVVNLIGSPRSRKHLVSRLVCAAFHGAAPDARSDAAHGDGNPLNNRADNLRWASRSENMEDARQHGTLAAGARHGRTTKPERTPRGERHGHAKLTAEQVRLVRDEPRTPGSGRRLAEQFGVSPAAISMARSGKTWSSDTEASSNG